MSVRARQAYDMGAKPLSKWTKQDFLNAYPKHADFIKKQNLETLKENLLAYDSWHHTGKMFNKTDFYSLIDEEEIPEYKDWTIIEPTPKKPKADFEDGYYHGYYIERKYHPYSRYKRVEETKIPFSNARKKGDWLVFEDGSKKLFSNMNVEKQSKIRLSNRKAPSEIERPIVKKAQSPKPNKTPSAKVEAERPIVKKSQPIKQYDNPQQMFAHRGGQEVAETLLGKYPKEKVVEMLKENKRIEHPKVGAILDWKRDTGATWRELDNAYDYMSKIGDIKED